MSIVDGQLALMRRAADTEGAPNIVWPDGPGAELPRWVMQFAGGTSQVLTTKGHTLHTPEINIRVEVAEGNFANEAVRYVNMLMERFAMATRFEGLTIIDPPAPAPPMRMDGAFIIPVQISARMELDGPQ